MKGNVFIIALIVVFAQTANAQQRFEQYCYLGDGEASTLVPVMNYTSSEDWYVEGRYNYEEQNTFSLYGGKIFSGEKGPLAYSVTPLLGGVMGDFEGGSVGLNLALDFGNFFFSSQSQYTFAVGNEDVDFAYSWSEAGYQPLPWMYFGLSAQHTHMRQANTGEFEPGIVIGFEIGKWTFPVYGFNPLSNNTYFVLGINLDVGTKAVRK